MTLPCSLIMAQNLKLCTKPLTAKRFHTVYEGAVANKFICDSKTEILKGIKKEAMTLRKFPIIQSAQPKDLTRAESVLSKSGYDQLKNRGSVSRKKDDMISEFIPKNSPLLYLSCGLALITLQYFIHKTQEDTFNLDNKRDYSQPSAFSSCNEYTIGTPSAHRLLQYEEVYSRLR